MNLIIIFLLVLIKTLNAELIQGNPCNFELINTPGVCKPLDECLHLKNYNRALQTCESEENQQMVCCPNEIKPGAISKIKCKEYSVYAHGKTTSPVLILSDQPTRNECGHKIVKRIVGGEIASKKEFAHMALVGFQNKHTDTVEWLCGGSIISENYVLTAAHCYHPSWGQATHVRVGVTDINDVSNRKQDIKVSEFISHPNFRSLSVYNDIALLKLEKPIALNVFARPACLYTEEEITFSKAIATGWGVTSFAGNASDVLRKVTLDMIDYETCNKSYNNNISRRLKQGILKESQICAGSLEGEKDTCQGDAGGPLQIYHTGNDILCMYDIVGVISFGKACESSAAVYTKVSQYIKWIEDTVWLESKK